MLSKWNQFFYVCGTYSFQFNLISENHRADWLAKCDAVAKRSIGSDVSFFRCTREQVLRDFTFRIYFNSSLTRLGNKKTTCYNRGFCSI